MDVVIDGDLFQVTMTTRALGYAGEDVQAAMRRATRAHQDARMPTLLEHRRAQLVALLERDESAVRARARRLGLPRGISAAMLVECVARVELVRELLGPAGALEALPHQPEVP